MRPSANHFVALLFLVARPLVVQAQSSKFPPPQVMLRDAKHKEPKSGVQVGPGNTITIQSGVGTPTTINVLSFGKNGTLLAAGKDFGRVVVWDVVSMKFLCAIETGQGIVHAVAISPDGQTLATAGEGDDFKLKLWHLPEGKLVRTYGNYVGFIHSLAFGPTGEWIVFVENRGPTRVLDISTGRVLLELKETSFPVLSTDDTVLMTTNKTEFIIWKTSDWSKLRSLPRSPAYAVPLAVHPGSDKFVYSYAGGFSLARLSTGELFPGNQPAPLPKFNLSAGGFAAISTSAPDLVFGHSDGRLWAWDTKSGKICTSEVLYSESGVLSPNGTLLAGAKDNSILAQGRPPDGVLLWDTPRLVDACGFASTTTPAPTSQ
jgi:WD40 repeat protein